MRGFGQRMGGSGQRMHCVGPKANFCGQRKLHHKSAADAFAFRRGPDPTFSRTGWEDIQEIDFYGASCNRWYRCQQIGAVASTSLQPGRRIRNQHCQCMLLIPLIRKVILTSLRTSPIMSSNSHLDTPALRYSSSDIDEFEDKHRLRSISMHSSSSHRGRQRCRECRHWRHSGL